MAAGASPNVVLAALREQTHDLHRQTETALDLLRAVASRAQYAALLLRMLGFYEPLEERLFASTPAPLATILAIEGRRKSPALRADLEVLGNGAPFSFERCARLPDLAPGMAVVGAWYVVEGATLGGRVIATHLARTLSVTRDTGGRFFDSYGDARQARWEEFCQFLATLPDERAAEITAGAVATFEAMRNWLAGRPR